jgi:prophage antirepressor-like protein
MEIKLFSFQDKEVRTVLQGRDVWFVAQDVFTALDLQWRGKSSLKMRQIPDAWTQIKGYQTLGGPQETFFINEQAVYKLAFRANRSEAADLFTNWVAELLVKIRRGAYVPFAGKNPEDHMRIEVQKQNSKAINSKMFLDGDVKAIKEHNSINCKVHTGKSPKEVKAIGKTFGLKSAERTSAKEVIRHIRPELAASMSMADRLTGEKDVPSKKAAEVCKEFALPLFKKLREITETKAIQ